MTTQNPNALAVDAGFDDEPFTRDEIAEAIRLRQLVVPHHSLIRRDHCPHTPACAGTRECVDNIAWFLRHRAEIFARERGEL